MAAKSRVSEKLQKAVDYLRRQGAQALTRDLLRRGRRAGHAKSTLERAWRLLRENSSPPLSLNTSHTQQYMCNVPRLSEAEDSRRSPSGRTACVKIGLRSAPRRPARRRRW